MHYQLQRRKRFARWVDDGCPTTAVIDINEETRQVPAVLMLRRMRRCTDTLPLALATTISDHLGSESGSLRGRTYGEAARRLLASGATAAP